MATLNPDKTIETGWYVGSVSRTREGRYYHAEAVMGRVFASQQQRTNGQGSKTRPSLARHHVHPSTATLSYTFLSHARPECSAMYGSYRLDFGHLGQVFLGPDYYLPAVYC